MWKNLGLVQTQCRPNSELLQTSCNIFKHLETHCVAVCCEADALWTLGHPGRLSTSACLRREGQGHWQCQQHRRPIGSHPRKLLGLQFFTYVHIIFPGISIFFEMLLYSCIETDMCFCHARFSPGSFPMKNLQPTAETNAKL